MSPRGSGSGVMELAPGGRLVVEADRGEVEISGDETLQAVTFETVDGRVELQGAGQPGAGSVRLVARPAGRLRVRVPRAASVSFDGNAALRVRGLRGEVEADCGLGGVEIEDVEGDVRVDAGLGPVRVVRVRGSVEVDAGAGPVRLEAVTGRVAVDSGAGPVSGLDLRGEVVVDSGAGAVELDGVGGGRIFVDAGAGHVRLRFARAPQGDVEVDAGTGGVTLELPPGAAADVDLRSRRGTVTVDEHLHAETIERGRGIYRGRLGGGGRLIRVEAELGAVTLRTAERARGGEEPEAGSGGGTGRATGPAGAPEAAARAGRPSPGEVVAEAAASVVRTHAAGGSVADNGAPGLDEAELFVLRMVEAGTLSAAEAERLLSALRGEPEDGTEEPGGTPAPPSPSDDATPRTERQAGGASRAAGAVEASGRPSSDTSGMDEEDRGGEGSR
ncbi:MAG: DUF4097 family beta strand repeat protein [Firmicutes bacterium]|nr:DUF4097 family beta strand repeat protein [Bacillota bacterium]